MSFREGKLWTPQNDETIRPDFTNGQSPQDITNLFNRLLGNGVHGFCFSVYDEGQKPGDIITEEQVRRRMEILSKHTGWIRSFSCVEGNELIPVIAKEYGLKTLVGAWLGKDLEKNELEIEGLLKLAQAGFVDIAAVGNEVLYRKDLTEVALIDSIIKVKSHIPDIPVGYVDAYYEFVERPEVTAACDVILCNCYPYWEGTDIKYAFQHMQSMYHQAFVAAQGKKVIISETGWPNKGESFRLADPTNQNAMKYFINTQLWASENDIDVFYFSSFDESWKKASEGEVGAYWGIWDSNEKLKFQ